MFITILFNCSGESNKKQTESIHAIYDYTFENDLNISNLNKAFNYMINNMEYIKDDVTDDVINDYWQTPKETYNRRNAEGKMLGDCEDYCLFLLYITWTILEIDDSFMVIIKVKEDIGLDEPVWVSDHAIVQINGTYYEAQDGNELMPPNEDDIIWKGSYPEALWWAVNYHGLYID